MTTTLVTPLSRTRSPERRTAAPFRVQLFTLPWFLALGLILIVGAALRLPLLGAIPPGFQFDEAYNAIDAWRVVQGARDVFFPANGGREPLLSYWQALFLGTLGPTLVALRLASASVGLVTLAVVAVAITWLFRQRRDAAWLGLLTAAILAVTYWHVHFSRYSIRAIFVPLGMTLVFWAFAAGTGPRAPRALPLLACGVALAASVYAHPTGRLLPVALALYTAWLAWTDRRHAVGYLLSLALVGATSFALFLPLGFYFLDHQWLFWGHPSDVSIFDPVGGPGGMARTLLNQTLAVLGMVFVRGDRSNFHNMPYRPVFDPLMALCFTLGLVLVVRDAVRARGLNRSPYVLLLVWAGIAVLPTWLSDAAPNFSRAIGALPVLAFVAAAGLSGITAWLARRLTADAGRTTNDEHQMSASAIILRPASFVLPAVVLAFAAFVTARDHFVIWPASDPALYYAYDQDKEDAARLVQSWDTTAHVYMTPLWANHSTVAFLTRDHPPQAVEMERGLILPAADGQDAMYVFSAQQERRARRVGNWLGNQAEQRIVPDRLGAPLLVTYRLAGAARPQFSGAEVLWQGVRPGVVRQDAFVDAPSLVGFNPERVVNPGDDVQFTLYWRAPDRLDRDLTLFAHLVDASGKTVLQDDHMPLATSYPTSHWQSSEVIVDMLEYRLPDDFPVGDYTLRVGWYDLETGERRRLADGGTALDVTRLVVAPEAK